ncbi:3'-5' exonuclease [Flavobacterium degerlachei]|jgi:DNA polymerase-3 subunit epsilon|uniref:DNA polymerase-3 subunit epsilon n=1 Tax=Flavobacterium degerlachei TaxID=229203 RepID=A0A1H2Y8U8_9FLAO|nr:3'-5' exonuclease [Flavobacterium degerlachei]SDX01586.1 DNA polymerase-3 subunit epsilon [Flavobacterium degerlachei]
MTLFNWFKKDKKNYPEFWQNYLACFESKSDKNNQKRFVVFDTETTGLDVRSDVILSIGAIGIFGNSIVVNDYLELFVEQSIFKRESVPIHGILKEGKEKKLTETEAVIQFLGFIKDSTLVGHHVRFDVNMVNAALQRMGLGKLKNRSMDTDLMYQKFKGLPEGQHSGLDELCRVFKIQKSDRHTAAGDAFITALVFLRLKNK